MGLGITARFFFDARARQAGANDRAARSRQLPGRLVWIEITRLSADGKMHMVAKFRAEAEPTWGLCGASAIRAPHRIYLPPPAAAREPFDTAAR
jgi:hypothetical protein